MLILKSGLKFKNLLDNKINNGQVKPMQLT